MQAKWIKLDLESIKLQLKFIPLGYGLIISLQWATMDVGNYLSARGVKKNKRIHSS